MKKQFYFIPLIALSLSSCGSINDTFRALECNRQAIDMSTCAIEQNIQAIEEANRVIDENRSQLEAINRTLKESS